MGPMNIEVRGGRRSGKSHQLGRRMVGWVGGGRGQIAGSDEDEKFIVVGLKVSKLIHLPFDR